MKRGVIILLLVCLSLAGCASNKDPKREQIDGVECMVKRNAFGKTTAIDCDWDN